MKIETGLEGVRRTGQVPGHQHLSLRRPLPPQPQPQPQRRHLRDRRASLAARPPEPSYDMRFGKSFFRGQKWFP